MSMFGDLAFDLLTFFATLSANTLNIVYLLATLLAISLFIFITVFWILSFCFFNILILLFSQYYYHYIFHTTVNEFIFSNFKLIILSYVYPAKLEAG